MLRKTPVPPRLVISGLRGGSGKTILSVGIIAAWQKQGKNVTPFKKGPDYIDAGWLALAAGRPCYNLDTFLVSPTRIIDHFLSRAASGNMAVIEGNRGLYDSIDPEGSTSTAELAKLLKVPVILSVDATKITRTMAAVVAGCEQFDPEVHIRGVVLNRVAGTRHESILRKSIDAHCGIPVVGAVPKLKAEDFPERHMGLVPTPEHDWAKDSVAAAAEMAEKYLDLTTLASIASEAAFTLSSSTEPMTSPPVETSGLHIEHTAGQPRIGIIRDSAFQFYYPENIDALTAAGADIVFFSPLEQTSVPPVDAIYIGGGFPETHAAILADNVQFRQELKRLADKGLPIYAECGGLMYLGEELILDEGQFPMAGVLPIVYGFSKRPQGHGYTIFDVDQANSFYEVGSRLTGHEFHYSKVLEFRGDDDDLAFAMERGNGLVNGRDGAMFRNVLATYSHIHALGTPQWAEGLVRQAKRYRHLQAS